MGNTLQKRKPRRSRVLLSASLESAAGQQDVRIRDISIKGALLEAADPPSLEEEIVLSCGDNSLKGKVAWHDRINAGRRRGQEAAACGAQELSPRPHAARRSPHQDRRSRDQPQENAQKGVIAGAARPLLDSLDVGQRPIAAGRLMTQSGNYCHG